MYDFYANPPQSREQVLEWLLSWLELNSGSPTVVHNGVTYVQERGFSRAFHTHIALRNSETGEYGFWVFETSDRDAFKTFPTEWFPTYDEMLHHQADVYTKAWGLPQSPKLDVGDVVDRHVDDVDPDHKNVEGRPELNGIGLGDHVARA